MYTYFAPTLHQVVEGGDVGGISMDPSHQVVATETVTMSMADGNIITSTSIPAESTVVTDTAVEGDQAIGVTEGGATYTTVTDEGGQQEVAVSDTDTYIITETGEIMKIDSSLLANTDFSQQQVSYIQTSQGYDGQTIFSDVSQMVQQEMVQTQPADTNVVYSSTMIPETVTGHATQTQTVIEEPAGNVVPSIIQEPTTSITYGQNQTYVTDSTQSLLQTQSLLPDTVAEIAAQDMFSAVPLNTSYSATMIPPASKARTTFSRSLLTGQQTKSPAQSQFQKTSYITLPSSVPNQTVIYPKNYNANTASNLKSLVQTVRVPQGAPPKIRYETIHNQKAQRQPATASVGTGTITYKTIKATKTPATQRFTIQKAEDIKSKQLIAQSFLGTQKLAQGYQPKTAYQKTVPNYQIKSPTIIQTGNKAFNKPIMTNVKVQKPTYTRVPLTSFVQKKPTMDSEVKSATDLLSSAIEEADMKLLEQRVSPETSVSLPSVVHAEKTVAAAADTVQVETYNTSAAQLDPAVKVSMPAIDSNMSESAMLTLVTQALDSGYLDVPSTQQAPPATTSAASAATEPAVSTSTAIPGDINQLLDEPPAVAVHVTDFLADNLTMDIVAAPAEKPSTEGQVKDSLHPAAATTSKETPSAETQVVTGFNMSDKGSESENVVGSKLLTGKTVISRNKVKAKVTCSVKDHSRSVIRRKKYWSVNLDVDENEDELNDIDTAIEIDSDSDTDTGTEEVCSPVKQVRLKKTYKSRMHEKSLKKRLPNEVGSRSKSIKNTNKKGKEGAEKTEILANHGLNPSEQSIQCVIDSALQDLKNENESHDASNLNGNKSFPQISSKQYQPMVVLEKLALDDEKRKMLDYYSKKETKTDIQRITKPSTSLEVKQVFGFSHMNLKKRSPKKSSKKRDSSAIEHMETVPEEVHIEMERVDGSSFLRKALNAIDLPGPMKASNCVRCDECRETYPSQEQYLSHMQVVHHLRKTFTCRICNSLFVTQTGYDQHKQAHKNIQCQTCKMIIFDRTLLTLHIDECRHKKREFSQLTALDVFPKPIILFRSFCNICNEAFRDRRDLENHHRGEHMKCSPILLAGRTGVSLLRNKKLEKKKSLRQRGLVLKKITFGNRALWTTFAIKSGEKKSKKCKTCGKVFMFPHSLSLHKSIHNKLRLKRLTKKVTNSKRQHFGRVCRKKRICRGAHWMKGLGWRRQTSQTHVGKYLCQICNAYYFTQRGLEKHKQSQRHYERCHFEQNVLKNAHCCKIRSVKSMTKSEKQCLSFQENIYRHVNIPISQHMIQELNIVRKKDIHAELDTLEDPYVYTCNFCAQSFTDQPEMQIHVWSHRTVCERCHEGQGSIEDLIRHRAFVACKPKDVKRRHVKSQRKRQMGTTHNPFSCTLEGCSKVFVDQEGLETHLKTADHYPVSCSCGQSFENKIEQWKHVCLKNCKVTPSVKRQIDEVFFTNVVDKSNVVRSKEAIAAFIVKDGVGTSSNDLYRCILCKKQFKAAGLVRKHIVRRHMGRCRPKKFECKECDFMSDFPQLHQKHMERHLAALPCFLCNQYFDDRMKLDRHLKFHFKDKYECVYCAKLFSTEKKCFNHVLMDHSREERRKIVMGNKRSKQLKKINKKKVPLQQKDATMHEHEEDIDDTVHESYDNGEADNTEPTSEAMPLENMKNEANKENETQAELGHLLHIPDLPETSLFGEVLDNLLWETEKQNVVHEERIIAENRETDNEVDNADRHVKIEEMAAMDEIRVREKSFKPKQKGKRIRYRNGQKAPRGKGRPNNKPKKEVTEKYIPPVVDDNNDRAELCKYKEFELMYRRTYLTPHDEL